MNESAEPCSRDHSAQSSGDESLRGESSTGEKSGGEDESGGGGKSGGDRLLLHMVRDVRQGKICGKQLSDVDRRACIEYFWAEGVTANETAILMNISDRTIFRDRKFIKSKNALQPDQDLSNQIVGELYRRAEIAIEKLNKAVRDQPGKVEVTATGGTARWIVRSQEQDNKSRGVQMVFHAGKSKRDFNFSHFRLQPNVGDDGPAWCVRQRKEHAAASA